MKIWMSGEIQSDVGDAYRIAINAIEAAINRLLVDALIDADISQWTYLAIILPWDHAADYPEVQRKHLRAKSLEFRLNIDHERFLHGTLEEKQHLIIDSLERCITMMERFGVSQENRAKLNALLAQIRKSVPL